MIRHLTLLALLAGWLLAGCGSGADDSCATNNDCGDGFRCIDRVCVPLADGDPIDGDLPADGDREAEESPPVDGDLPADGDAEAEPEPEGACRPACDYDTGGWCDEAAGLCRMLACEKCWVDADCGPGRRCLNFRFEDAAGSEFTVCTRTGCSDDLGCDPGFACIDYICRPRALCQVEAGNPTQDRPCPYGTVNTDGVQCRGETNCIGIPPQAQATCAVDADCAGLQAFPNPDCVGGQCGWSSCMAPCDNGGCDPLHQPTDVGGTCYCMLSVEAQDFGQECTAAGVHPAAGPCAAGLVCVSTGENPQATCSRPADCAQYQAPWSNPVADCSGGSCRWSVCARPCEGTACPEGGRPDSSGGQCLCLP